jgi:hypothetical protein
MPLLFPRPTPGGRPGAMAGAGAYNHGLHEMLTDRMVDT